MKISFGRVLNWLLVAGVFCNLMTTPAAYALPVLNGNTPSNQMVTIYPDHQDKNLFYLVPRKLKMAIDLQGQPEFLYTEVSQSFFTTDAVIQVSMTPDFDESELKAAKNSILASNPQAKFAVVPFIRSKLAFDNKLAGLVESADCNHNGGVVGSEQACIITLSSQGRRVLLDSLKKRGTIYIHFQYDVAGVSEDAKKGYESVTGTWDISGAIGGTELSTHPELFLDSHGLPIDFDSIDDTRPVLNEAFQISKMDKKQAASILGRLSVIRMGSHPMFSPGVNVQKSDRLSISDGVHFWGAGNKGDDEIGCRNIKLAWDNAQDVLKEMNETAFLLTARVKGRLGPKANTPDLVAKDGEKLTDIAREFDRIFPAEYNDKTETEHYYWSIADFSLERSPYFHLIHRDLEGSSVTVKEVMLPELVWNPEQASFIPDIEVSGEFRKLGGSEYGTSESVDTEFSVDRASSPLYRCLGPKPAIQIDAHVKVHAHCFGNNWRCDSDKVIDKDIVLTLN